MVVKPIPDQYGIYVTLNNNDYVKILLGSDLIDANGTFNYVRHYKSKLKPNLSKSTHTVITGDVISAGESLLDQLVLWSFENDAFIRQKDYPPGKKDFWCEERFFIGYVPDF